MAEFLIYKGPHWMDALTPEQVADRVAENPKWQKKYDRRYREGDIIEVQPDGKWPNHSQRTPFYTVKIPGLSVETAKKYMMPLYDTTDSANAVLTRRRKWRLLVSDIPPLMKEELLTTGVITVPWDKVEAYVQEKGL